jgi:CheY-like chemotaxis protein
MATGSISPFIPVKRKPADRIGWQYARAHRDVRHFLVMDDEDIIREVVGTFISSMGYAVLEVREGSEALQICDEAVEKGLRICGAILDLTVTDGMSGREAVVGLRSKYPDMPIIASSSCPEDPVMVWPTGYGFTDSIAKPFRKYELIEKLNRHLAVNSQ